MKFIRTPEGAFFQESDTGSTVVSDPRTLASLSKGSLPYETRSLFKDISEPTQTDPTLTKDAQIDDNSPLTKFNLALMEMLKEAQKGGPSEQDYAHQRAIERAKIQKSSEMTPEELRVLSPAQQKAVREGNVSALEPEADAIAAKIKSQDQRLTRFENLLSTAKDFGEEFSKNIAPSKEIIEGYRRMIREGGQPTSIPDEIRNKVLSSLTEDDWSKWAEANKKGKLDELSYAQGIAREDKQNQQKETRAQSIAGQFRNEDTVKRYNVISEGMANGKSLINSPSNSANDIAFIYAFAKAMDPDSVVREGEYATVQKYAQSWAEAFGFKAARIFSNIQFLTKEAKTNMLGAMQNKYNSISPSYQNVYKEYSRRIDNALGKQGEGVNYLTDYAGGFAGQESEKETKVIKGVTYVKESDGLWHKQ